MTRRIMYLSVALALVHGPLLAQSDSDDASASVQIVGTIDVVTTENIDFGPHSKIDGVVLSSAIPTRAGWAVTLDTFHDIQIDFVLPGQLIDGSGGSVLPLQYGPTAAHLMDGFADVTFDPASGFQLNDVAPGFEVYLGEDNNRDGSGNVTVDVTDGVTGLTYTGVITMTVTIL